MQFGGKALRSQINAHNLGTLGLVLHIWRYEAYSKKLSSSAYYALVQYLFVENILQDASQAIVFKAPS